MRERDLQRLTPERGRNEDMIKPRPFRFSAVIDQARPQKSQHLSYADEQFSPSAGGEQHWSRDGWAAKAHWVEDLGYTMFLVADHPWLDVAPTPALMMVADTTSLRIGSYVFNVDIRHPALLAKDMAMLDVLSNGRFEGGPGCGAIVDDYTQTGLVFEQPGVRVSRFQEALCIIKRFLTEETVTFTGQYYCVTGLPGHPKPLQKPHLPLYIGGGSKRVLSLAAREADCVGLSARSTPKGIDWASATHEANIEKVAWLHEAEGERFDQLEIGTPIFVVVRTEDRLGTAQHMASRFGLTPEQLLSCTHMLFGTADQMVEELLQRRERYGMSSIAVIEAGIEAFAPVVARLTGT
jgi:probable F420-dependent oxidoreductase